MGGSSSKSRTTVQNTLVSSAMNKCGSVAVDNSIKIDGLNFRCPSWCKTCTFNEEQASAVDANCVIDNAQSALADVFAASNASADAGIGVAVGDTKTTIKTKIENYVQNQCADVGVRNAYEGKNLNIEACEYKRIQSADVSSTCKLGVLQGIESTATAKSEAEAKGMNPMDLILGFLLAFWMPILIGIVVLIVGIIGLKMLLSGGGKGGSTVIQMPQMPQMTRGAPLGRR